MRPSRALAVAAMAALALATGCTTQCQDLANRICSCTVEGPSRDACEKQAKSQLKGSDIDEAYCAKKLETCHDAPNGATLCEILNTEQGKAACGIAYPSPDGGNVIEIPDGGTPDGGAPDAGP
jgi:hypothetical protein